MTDLKERLEEHARWLEEAGESKVRAHVNPETCKRAARDIRQVVEDSNDQSKPEETSERAVGGIIENTINDPSYLIATV